MAYGIVHQFPGGTQEQYEASIAVVHPSDGSLPEGQLLHVAGPSADGWTIVAVHDSQESWERFRDSSIGRWRKELAPEQLADVEAEAGSLLADLGYR